jgi:hypothetical protein
MEWNVAEVWPKGPREIGVRFEDGLEGTVRIDWSFCVGVFEALADDEAVHAATVANGAVTWPNGLDLASDAMYDRIKADPDRYYEVSRLRKAA